MNCKSFDRLIESFIEKKGDIKEAVEFMKHMDECESCRRDFESDFYAFWGLKMLNNPEVDSYDIHQEMVNTIADARKRARNEQYLKIIIALLIAAACIVVLFFILNN